jgi:hypothetical protein
MSFEDDILSLNGPQYHRDHSSSFGETSWTSLQRSRLDSTNWTNLKGARTRNIYQAVDRCVDVVVSVIPHWGSADTNTEPAARCWDGMKSVLMSRGSSFRYSSSWRLMELQLRETPILILLSSCVLLQRAAAPWIKLCLNLLSALDLQRWSTSENGGRVAILSRINNTSIKLVWRPPRERVIFDSVFNRQSSCIFSAVLLMGSLASCYCVDNLASLWTSGPDL